MQKWEYLVLIVHMGKVSNVGGERKRNLAGEIFSFGGLDIQEVLNQLGEQGWDLCGTLSSDTPAAGQLILKRAKL